ncbi:MAG: hypothetical protein HPY83_19065 [Anaerolineae bacterium]|nr:hypothetical protein [Anaerolineae bacterium]
MLVQDRFEHLPCEQQKQYLQLVQASEDYEMLRPVSQWLTGRWRQVFDEFTADHPGPVRPDLLVQPSRVWVGPTSPKDAGELASMPLSELVEFLAAWAPAGQFMSPSPEGLGRTLSEAVASNPVRFAQEARQFIGSDPTYVRHFVSGLREAAEKGSSFSWGPVLELCQWAVEQPREQARATQELEYREPHWGWTRQEIAKLLSTGFEKRQSEMPYELRRPAWVVLEPITDDPDPTSEHEAEYGGDNMDPATMSINTVRGEAMHAVVRYALWVRRHLEGLPDSHERLGKGFDEMPEVRAVLDRHLDSNADPTLTVRSVYGKWFPWLALLDRNWARARVERIFPSLEPTSRLRDAAWDSYVSFCDAYDEVYELVQDQYKQAVHRLGETQKRPLRLRSPDEYLAQHLMALYVRGTVTLDEPDGILAQVYARANDSLRAHALSSIGGRIAKTPGLSEVAKERLHRLWQWRLDEAQIAGDVEAHREEMAAFGWWFTSGRFDETWALDQLAAVLKLAGWVEPTALVLERLAEMAAREPGRATECLDALIENDARGWAILGSHEEIRSILQTALHNQHQETRRSAEATVNKLLARGHLNFRDLLRS